MSEIYVKRAIETAINGMAGMNAITSSSVAAATVITTTSPHGLTTGMGASIIGHSGSTPSINGNYIVTVTGASTFTIPVAVTVAGTGGGFTLTSWQNVPFTPPAPSTPWQQVWFPSFNAENPTMGDAFYRIHSYFQIDLMYPLLKGTASIDTRVSVIKALFKRGASFTNNNITTRIEETPNIIDYGPDGNFYKKCIKVRYWADIFP
jgi:hypothetical protein